MLFQFVLSVQLSPSVSSYRISSTSRSVGSPRTMVATKAWVAERLPSEAVTVTSALPAATPVTATVSHETATAATSVSEELAEYSRSSPSGSAKRPQRST